MRLVVAGVPIGDTEFVRVHLASTVSEATSKCKNITSLLRSECRHTLNVLNLRCLQPVLSYWLQHVYPSDMLFVHNSLDVHAVAPPPSPAAAMDEALLDVACASQGEFLRDDSLCEARLLVDALRVPAVPRISVAAAGWRRRVAQDCVPLRDGVLLPM